MSSPLRAQGDLGVDLQGRPIRTLAGPGIRVVVLVFAAGDCPISNRYVPEIARLSRQFGAAAANGAAVKFWWVFPNPGDTAAVISEHNREYAIRESALLDPKQSLVALAHVTITPEAAVFVVHGGELEEVYHGRIDDRYVSLGEERPRPQQHDLEAAIQAALDGKTAPQPRGPAVGCSIVFLQK